MLNLNEQIIKNYFRDIFYHCYNFSNNSNIFYGVELKTEPLKNRAILFSVEKKLKFKIPQDYKNVILKCSGINIDLTIDDYNDNKGSFVGDSFYGYNWNKINILKEIDNLKELFDSYLEEDFISDEIGDLLYAPMLPIGSGDAGDIYAIDLSRNDLYWFQHDDSNFYYLGPVDHVFKLRVKSFKDYKYYHQLSDREFLSLINKLPKKPLKDTSIINEIEKLLENKIPNIIKNIIINSSGIVKEKNIPIFIDGYHYFETFRGLDWNKKEDVIFDFETLHIILKDNTNNKIGPYTIDDKKYLIPIGSSYGGDLYVLDMRNYKVYEYFRDAFYEKGIWIPLEKFI